MKAELNGYTFDAVRPVTGPERQKGALTIFTGIFVLILMTLMLLYAARIGVFEQRISANENRQKLAFHAAETALDQAVEYLVANVTLAASGASQAGGDGQGGFRAGWFNSDTTVNRWKSCAGFYGNADHPCGGDVPALNGSFFYDDPGTTNSSDFDSLPLNTGALAANTTARATATICLLVISGSASSCSGDPSSDEDDDHRMLVTVMGYGYSDCANTANPATCRGEATVAVPFTSKLSFGAAGGVPLVTKNSLPATGTAEIAVAPNAGGIGVPVSVWANGQTSCPPKDSSGIDGNALDYQDASWATCQYHEWFGSDSWPDPLECPTASCKCDTDELISGPIGGGNTLVSSDIQVDPSFPCDLFAYYFGTTDWQAVKAGAQVYSDCSALDESSSGFIWVEGNCLINSNTVIGSEDDPVSLVLAGASTDIRGGAVIYGTVVITEVENPGAKFEANGGMTVFGQVVVDAIFSKLQGSFQVVYDDGIIARAGGAGGLGQLNHGWRDWGLPDITWN